MRKLEVMPDFYNVGAGNKATLELPRGLSYDMIAIEYTGTAASAAMLERIELKGNGKLIQEYAAGFTVGGSAISGGELVNELNKYYGRGVKAGIINLWQVRPELSNIQQRRMFTLGTQDLQTLTLSVKVAAGAPSDFGLKAYAIRSESQPSGLVTLTREFPITFSAGGEQSITNLPFTPAASIGAIHFNKAQDDITDLRVLINSKDFYELPTNIAENVQTDHLRDPSTVDWVRADWVLEGDISQALIHTGNVNDFRIKPTLTTGGQVSMFVEYFGAIGSV